MYIEVNGARLFFDTVGSALAVDGERMAERPALIVLHGGPGFDHSLMRPYFDRFADTHQVIYLDHRGNGRSGGEPRTWRLDQWGDDIAAFCDTLGIVKPAVLGLSFGGMVAMAYATRHPDHPSKLILSSTAARLDLEATYAMMERLGGERAAEVARRFWSDPSPEIAGEYMAVCMPLYNPGDDPAFAQARARAITRFEVMFDFIQREQTDHGLHRRSGEGRLPDSGAGWGPGSDHAGRLRAGNFRGAARRRGASGRVRGFRSRCAA